MRAGTAARSAVANAAGLALGAALDAAFGDPGRWHPVAGYGRAAAALERRLYAPEVAAGARYVGWAVGLPTLAAVAATIATRRRPLARTVLVAGLTWTALGGTSLRREAVAMADALDAEDLPAARARLPHLCGRDPSTLDSAGLARATVESVAENTSDAVVAPLLWGALAGAPGLVAYRAVNTLDAMVGHRSERYARFGTAAARLDDAANLVPSRLTAALTVAAAPVAGGSRWRALWTWLRDGRRHPSPNSGQCEAAMAGALGVRLGGRNVYAGRVEHRPILGRGAQPVADDIRRAARLSGTVAAAAVTLAVGYPLWRACRRSLRPSADLAVVAREKRGTRGRIGHHNCKIGGGWAARGRGWAGVDGAGTAGRWYHLGCGQERAHRGYLPLAVPARSPGRTLQGPEHVEQLGRGSRRRWARRSWARRSWARRRWARRRQHRR